jgi:hypothetical protein
MKAFITAPPLDIGRRALEQRRGKRVRRDERDADDQSRAGQKRRRERLLMPSCIA